MATTIGKYAVGLTLDARGYIDGSKLARSETAAIKRMINQARSPAENYARSVNLLDKAVRQGAIDQGVYNRLVDESAGKMQKAASATSNWSAALGRMAVAYFGFSAVKNFTVDAAKLAMQAESAAITFEVLTGSIEDSADLLKDLKQLAASSPLSFGNTQDAAKTMLSFGLATEQIMPSLRQLGDITGGNSERFKMMTLAYSQMTAAGRLMGQDLLQMINAGFNPLQEISRQTGESLIDLRKRMEEGGISSQEVARAFQSATEAGGKFFGMIERRGETTEGRLDRMNDRVDELKRTIGEFALNDEFQAQIEGMTILVKDMNDGLKALSSNDTFIDINGLHSKTELRSELKAIEEKAFMDEQIRRRRAGMDTIQTPGSKAASMAAAAEAADAPKVFGDGLGDMGLGGFISDGLESIKSGAGGLMSLAGVVSQSAATIALTGTANTQELIKSAKEDPAIKSLEVGTQEAYQFLTQASRDAAQQARTEAEKKRVLEENAKAQREKMNEWLERINDALADNGFKRIR